MNTLKKHYHLEASKDAIAQDILDKHKIDTGMDDRRPSEILATMLGSGALVLEQTVETSTVQENSAIINEDE